MTRLELFTKFLSDFTGKPENELLTWSAQGMSPVLWEKLSMQIPDEEADALMAEYLANPSEVMDSIAGFIGGDQLR